MIISKPDGTIQIESSGCCCPPGMRRKGQHTNSTTCWVRIDLGEWKIVHSISRAVNEARKCGSVEEFLKLSAQ